MVQATQHPGIQYLYFNSPYVLGRSPVWAERESPSPLSQTVAIVCFETQTPALSGWMWGRRRRGAAGGGDSLPPPSPQGSSTCSQPRHVWIPAGSWGSSGHRNRHQRQGGAWWVRRQKAGTAFHPRHRRPRVPEGHLRPRTALSHSAGRGGTTTLAPSPSTAPVSWGKQRWVVLLQTP